MNKCNNCLKYLVLFSSECSLLLVFHDIKIRPLPGKEEGKLLQRLIQNNEETVFAFNTFKTFSYWLHFNIEVDNVCRGPHFLKSGKLFSTFGSRAFKPVSRDQNIKKVVRGHECVGIVSKLFNQGETQIRGPLMIRESPIRAHACLEHFCFCLI